MLFVIGGFSLIGFLKALFSDIKKSIKTCIAILIFILMVGSIITFFAIQSNTHEVIRTKTIPIVSFNYYGFTEEREETIWDGYASHTYIVTDEKEEYVYYYQNEDGGYKQGSIPSENTVIYENEKCVNPSIIVYSTYVESDYYINKKWADLLCGPFPTLIGDKIHSNYEIHVPKGTIINE